MKTFKPIVVCPCGSDKAPKKLKETIKCTLCENLQHTDCIKPMNQMTKYLCPECQIKTSDIFVIILNQMLSPSLFRSNNLKKILQTFSFIPDLEYFNSIPKHNSNDDSFIIIRSLRFDQEGFSFHWPRNAQVFLNGLPILNLVGAGPKSKLDKPIVFAFSETIDNKKNDIHNFPYDLPLLNIKDYIKDCRNNRLEILIDPGKKEIDKNVYAIAVDYCEVIKDVEDVIKTIEVIEDKNKLKDFLTKNGGYLSKEIISLIDVFTETEKVHLPSRGFDCCHLGIFDLKTFLIMNRKTKKYECPLCKKIANKLYIDGIILNYLKAEEYKKKTKLLLDFEYNLFPCKNDEEDFNLDDINDSDIEMNTSEINQSQTNNIIKQEGGINDLNNNYLNNNNTMVLDNYENNENNIINISEENSSDENNNYNNIETHEENTIENINNNNRKIERFLNQIREEIVSPNKQDNNKKNKNLEENLNKNNNINIAKKVLNTVKINTYIIEDEEFEIFNKKERISKKDIGDLDQIDEYFKKEFSLEKEGCLFLVNIKKKFKKNN